MKTVGKPYSSEATMRILRRTGLAIDGVVLTEVDFASESRSGDLQVELGLGVLLRQNEERLLEEVAFGDAALEGPPRRRAGTGNCLRCGFLRIEHRASLGKVRRSC